MSKSNKVPYLIAAALLAAALVTLFVFILQNYPIYDVLTEKAESIVVTLSDGTVEGEDKEISLTEERKEVSQIIDRILHFPRKAHLKDLTSEEFAADLTKKGYICKINYKDQQLKMYLAENEDRYQVCIFRARRGTRMKFDANVFKDAQEGKSISQFIDYLKAKEREI